MATRTPEAIRDDDLDLHEFARAAALVLRRAVPFDAVAVVWSDPATGLPVLEYAAWTTLSNPRWPYGAATTDMRLGEGASAAAGAAPQPRCHPGSVGSRARSILESGLSAGPVSAD